MMCKEKFLFPDPKFSYKSRIILAPSTAPVNNIIAKTAPTIFMILQKFLRNSFKCQTVIFTDRTLKKIVAKKYSCSSGIIHNYYCKIGLLF
jgi:hypothetical protein